MTPHDVDRELRLVLTPLRPDPVRAERVRARCFDLLERHRRRSERIAAVGDLARHVAPVVLAGLCALYVVDLMTHVVRVFTR